MDIWIGQRIGDGDVDWDPREIKQASDSMSGGIYSSRKVGE